MFAVVENDQCVFVAEKCGQPALRVDGREFDAQHAAQRARHQMGRWQRTEANKPDAIGVRSPHGIGHRHSDGRLADPAWADDGDQAAPVELLRQCRDDRRAADDAREQDRDVVATPACDRRRFGLPIIAHADGRCDEGIAPSRNGDNVAMAALAVAEGSAQSVDLNVQIRFFDERFPPDLGYQFLLADHLAGASDESGQDVKGAAAEPHRLVALEQEPLRCKELERAK